jgi:hypothetical protein
VSFAVSGAAVAHADPTKNECADADEAAQSLRGAGKLRDAMGKLKVCVSKSCPGPVREDCAVRLDELERVLPTVVFEVHDKAGADVLAVRVRMDGAVLTDRLDGTSTPVDPGKHVFRFEASGFASLEASFVIREGDVARRESVVLEPVRSVSPSGAPGGVDPLRAGAYASLAVGAVGLVVGSIFGAVAVSDKSALSSHCAGTSCPASEQGDIDGLSTSGAASTVGITVGVVGAAAGAVLFYLSHKSGHDRGPSTAWVMPAPGGVAVRF